MPIVHWVASLSVPGFVICIFAEIIKPGHVPPIVMLIYGVTAVFTGLVLSVRFNQHIADDVLTETVRLPRRAEARYQSRSIAGAWAVRVHTKHCLGAFLPCYQVQRPEIVTADGVVQLAPSSDAEAQARLVAAHLGLGLLEPRAELLHARSLLRHPRFCLGLLVFQAIPISMWSDHRSMYEAYIFAYRQFFMLWGIIAILLFIKGAWYYYKPGFVAFACATWCFGACALVPLAIAKYCLVTAFEDSVRVQAELDSCILTPPGADTIYSVGTDTLGREIKLSNGCVVADAHYDSGSGSRSVRLRAPAQLQDWEPALSHLPPMAILASRTYPDLVVPYDQRADVRSGWPHPAFPLVFLTLSATASGLAAACYSARRRAALAAAEDASSARNA